ncbi:MAG: hypothetical protein ACREFR_00730 [Limisphaerales bacterium]
MKFFQSFRLVLFFGAAALVPKVHAVTATPLPSLQIVMQRVLQTSEDENAEYHLFNQHYFYTREKVTEFFDGSGKLKERKEKQSTNNPARRFMIHSAAPARAPAPAPAAFVLAGQKKARTDDPPNVHGVALGKKEDLMRPDIINRFKFTLVGRDMINGRPALVIDFAPISDSLPVLNIKDRFIDSVEGRGWVDEKDFTLEKVELHLKQKVSVLGGIAGSVSKFTLSFDRDRTSDGFWFTRDLNWHVEAREATVRRVVDHHEEILGVQKVR